MSEEWYDSETETTDEYSVKEYDITSSPNDFNIKTLFDFIESGALIIPGFQRNFVWDIARSSKLIESILIGLPIPQIFLYEESRNKFLVIDGQQRLMSIYYFIKQRFPRKEARTEIRKIFGQHGHIPEEVFEDDKFFRRFNLSLSDPLPGQKNRFHGLNYPTLGDHKISFDLRTIRNVIVKQNLPEKDDSSVYEIFNRLNSGGINLRPQEIRASLYHSKFYELLFKLNIDPRWRRLLYADEPDLHMRDVEILLRSYAMLIEGHSYKASMAKFLNNFSKNSKSLNSEQISYLEELFDAFLTACEKLPPRIFFGKIGRRFLTLYFEAVFAACCKKAFDNRNTEVAELTVESLRGLFDDSEFAEASQSETATKSNVDTRLLRAKTIIGG